MRNRLFYFIAGLAVLAAAGLIADRTTHLRKYVLPDHISTDGKMLLPNGWHVTPAGRHIKLAGDLPMKMIVTNDGKLLVNTAGWHDHDIDVIDIASEKLEQSLDVGKNWDGMSLDPASGTVYLSSGGTPKKGWDTAAAGLKHKIPPEAMAAMGKPVLRAHYENGRLSFCAAGGSQRSFFRRILHFGRDGEERRSLCSRNQCQQDLPAVGQRFCHADIRAHRRAAVLGRAFSRR